MYHEVHIYKTSNTVGNVGLMAVRLRDELSHTPNVNALSQRVTSVNDLKFLCFNAVLLGFLRALFKGSPELAASVAYSRKFKTSNCIL